MTPLFRQALGDGFDALAPSLRILHRGGDTQRYHGEVEVDRGRGLLAALCSGAMRLPQAGRSAIEVEIAADPDGERWTRNVAGRAMRSRLWMRDGLLCERLGFVTLSFRLRVEAGTIIWQVARARVLDVPLPCRWFARVSAHEYEENGCYRFDVSAALPLVGVLVHYRGWLDVG